jgi:transcriptional regulator with XRE-family HTH domain
MDIVGVEMDRDGLQGALRMLGWSQAELGRRLGVSANGVSAWATGAVSVPKYVEEYLRVALLAKEILR